MGGRTATRRDAGDRGLVADVRAGNEDAFAALYDRHAAELHAYCRHLLGSGHDAEDVLQQTFWKAYRRMREGRHVIAIRPWLFTIARNECLTMLRTRRAERNRGALPPLPAGAGAASVAQGREEVRDALADLARLPGEQRDALILSGLEKLSGAQVGRMLKTDPARVKALVFRARRAMATSRQGREASCAGIRAQLVTLSGGSLRRRVLREHLLACPGCREFRMELRAAGAAPAAPRHLRTTPTAAVSGARSIRTGA